MAVFDPVSNFGYGVVTVAPSPATSGTTLTLTAGEGALFPDPATDGDFNVVAYPPDTGPLLSNAEIIRLTGIAGDVLTFTRAQEGTSAKSIAVGWQIAFAPTAKTMQDIFDAINAIAPGAGTVTTVSVTTANGVSGSVANPTTTPAITLTLGAITPTSVAASGNVTGANLSGNNTGDQTSVTGNAGTATALQTGRTISLTGDVTATTGSFDGTANATAAATIANDAVTYAKMQNVSAASRLIGRGSAGGAGNPEEIALGSGLSMTGTTLSATGGGSAANVTNNGVSVLDYGALADGRFVDDFVTVNGDNTVTSATAAFVAGDVGKGIGIVGAGAAGIPLTTTIASINSPTSAEVTTAPSVSIPAGANGIIGTDNTSAFQDAIDDLDSVGGGALFVPAGVYFINGNFVVNPAGFETGYVNSQLVFPARSFTTDAEYNFSIIGAGTIAPNTNWLGDESPPLSMGGTIICSMKFGSVATASIFASGPPTGAEWLLSAIRVNFENITFRTYDNPKITPLNLSRVGQATVDGCLIDTGTILSDVSEPTNGGLALILPATNNWVISQAYDLDIVGYAKGIRWSEHASINEVRIFLCGSALNPTDTNHGSWVGKVEVTACTKTIEFEDVYGSGSAHRLFIGNIAVEHEDTFSDWRDWTVDVDDHDDLGRGIIHYSAVLGGVGEQDEFIFNGGDFLRVINLSAIGKAQYTTLTDGATITYSVPLGPEFNHAKVTLGGNRTLAMTGLRDGAQGEIIVVQDGTGSRTLALPAGSRVANGGAGVITLSTAAGAEDIVRWRYSGTTLYFDRTLNYTSTGAFNPADFGTVRSWFKADAITGLSDNDPVDTWPDSGPNNVDATASGTARPTYKTAIQNGLPVVRFDGATDVMGVSTSTGAQIRTVIAVYKTTNAASQNVVSAYGSGVDDAVLFENGNISAVYAGTSLPESVSALADWKAVAGVFNGGSSSVRSNGNSGTTGAAGAGVFTNGYALGSYTITPSGLFDGDMAEVIIYDGACSDIPAVIAALRAKWGF